MYLLRFLIFFCPFINPYFTSIFLQNLYCYIKGKKALKVHIFLVSCTLSEGNTMTIITASGGAVHCIATR